MGSGTLNQAGHIQHLRVRERHNRRPALEQYNKHRACDSGHGGPGRHHSAPSRVSD
ncbi:hypothetical protein [Proteus mirabilis]|uniref:hypothetical protein n=1 Tax=Proteus mirabilis TaxID=584 RepID=UPI0013D1636F|nr:hypothetical protein [Proteus mirabilis]